MLRWRNGIFCPSLGEVSFTTVPFLVSHLREIGIPGLLSQWIYIASLTLGNTGSLQASALTQAHLQPLPEISLFKAINPSCLKNLKVPRVKKKKRIGTNSYFTLTGWKPVCLSKFTYHSGLIRPHKKKKKKKRKFHGNINKPFRNTPASVGFQNQCCTTGNAVKLQLKKKKMLFWRMCWWDEWWWWGADASERNLSLKQEMLSQSWNSVYNLQLFL